MVTLLVSFAFKGTTKQFAKAMFICLTIDCILFMSCLPSVVNAQDKQQCAGITKAGTQCKHKVTGMYCVQHNPDGIHCADTTRTGKQCSRPVKKTGGKCFQHNKPTAYLYNAYSPEYDKNFVLKSLTQLRNDTLVHFNDKTVATNRNTPYTARIISLYTK